MDNEINALLKPSKLWTRSELLKKSCPVPQKPGLYAWYFKEIPPGVPIEDSVNWKGLTFLYLGISPRTSLSQGNIRKRIRYHYRGNAYGSTLRLSLGCLLSKKLGIQLKKYGSGKRKHFGEEEVILSQWMAENAYVTWMVFQKPWTIEDINFTNKPSPQYLRQ